MIGSANIFFKFLDLLDSIIILIIFFGFSAFVDYRLFIKPILKNVITNKNFLYNRILMFFTSYLVFGIIAAIIIFYISHYWVIFLLPLYYAAVYPAVLIHELFE